MKIMTKQAKHQSKKIILNGVRSLQNLRTNQLFVWNKNDKMLKCRKRQRYLCHHHCHHHLHFHHFFRQCRCKHGKKQHKCQINASVRRHNKITISDRKASSSSSFSFLSSSSSLLLLFLSLFRLLNNSWFKIKNKPQTSKTTTLSSSETGIFSKWNVFIDKILLLLPAGQQTNKFCLTILTILITILSTSGQEFHNADRHIRIGRGEHSNWPRIPLSSPSFSRQPGVHGLMDDGMNVQRLYGTGFRAGNQRTITDFERPIMRQNWPNVRSSLIDNHHHHHHRRRMAPDIPAFGRPFPSSTPSRLPFPGVFPSPNGVNSHSSFMFPSDRFHRRPHYSRPHHAPRFDPHHWPEMPAMPEFPKQSNPTTARGMDFRKADSRDSQNGNHDSLAPAYLNPNAQSYEPNNESNDEIEQTNRSPNILQQQEHQNTVEKQGKNDHENAQANHEKGGATVVDNVGADKIDEENRNVGKNQSNNENDTEYIINEHEKASDNVPEKVNNHVNNDRAENDTENEVISSEEKSHLGKADGSQQNQNERRISRRRLSPVEYEKETKIAQEPNVGQTKQPALIATRLSELYPDHIEVSDRKSNSDNNVNNGNTSVPNVGPDSSSEQSSIDNRTHNHRYNDRHGKFERVKQLKSDAVEETKVNNDLTLPNNNAKNDGMTTLDAVQGSSGAGIVNGHKNDKEKLVEKEYSNRDRGFGFVKAWAWDRAENYNVKEADKENGDGNNKNAKYLTSDRFMNRILKPSRL